MGRHEEPNAWKHVDRDEKNECHHDHFQVHLDVLWHVGSLDGRVQATEPEQLQQTESVKQVDKGALAVPRERSKRHARDKVDEKGASEVAFADGVRVFHFDTQLWIEVSCAEFDYNVQEEDKVDTGINKSDNFALEKRKSFLFVKDLQWDQNRVIKRKHDDQVVPVLDESTTTSE